ncbi:DUF4097 family beta strand repeat-containing protein [Aeromicrobium marinum]|uniref:DUF4097 family beta strand repeat-containing protein n=1 Tax=Aeromicrobium marinum TaxID=219314 RepID=UPI0001BCC660|nr:DUF4097 family beta strand repeat-containing protein [Aeromicrobium marinum]
MTRLDRYGEPGPAVVGEYDVRSPMSRTLLSVGIAVVVLAVLAGAVVASGLVTRSDRTAESTLAVDDLALVRLVTDGADVTVVRSRGAEVEVSATITEGWTGTDFDARRDGDDIVLSASCLGLVTPGCGVAVTVGVPAGFPIVIAAASGDLRLDGLDGVVTARSDTGDIEAADLAVVELDLRTGSGDIDVEFGVQPFGFKARTASGDVEATMPDGDTTYVVQVGSESGDVESDLQHDGDGQGFVTVETDTGDIEIDRS